MYIETSIEKRMKSIFLSDALFGSAIHFVGIDNTYVTSSNYLRPTYAGYTEKTVDFSKDTTRLYLLEEMGARAIYISNFIGMVLF